MSPEANGMWCASFAGAKAGDEFPFLLRNNGPARPSRIDP
jgi:hypothetical protein